MRCLHNNAQLIELIVTLCLADATEGKAAVDRVMTSVKGGNLESAVAMRAKLDRDGVMDIPTFQNWARTINNAPALINSQVKDQHRSKVQERVAVSNWLRFSATRRRNVLLHLCILSPANDFLNHTSVSAR